MAKLTANEQFEQAFGVSPDRIGTLNLYEQSELLQKVVQNWLIWMGSPTARLAQRGVQAMRAEVEQYARGIQNFTQVRDAFQEPEVLAVSKVSARDQIVARMVGLSPSMVRAYRLKIEGKGARRSRGRPRKT